MVWSRDVPHDRIVEECVEALHGRLCAPPDAAAAGDLPPAMGVLR
jgi:shikimate kinase